MKHHLAHFNRIDVSVGQTVKKGQQIGLEGKTGTSSVHSHYEVQKIFRTWTAYTQGMSKNQILEHYADPRPYQPTVMPNFTHYGWEWLSDIGGGQLHPGIDLNAGVGDTDLNTPIYSPVDGKVIYVGEDGGWGKHLFIEEATMNLRDVFQNQPTLKLSDSPVVYVGIPNEQAWAEINGQKLDREVDPNPKTVEVEKIIYLDKPETMKLLEDTKIKLAGITKQFEDATKNHAVEIQILEKQIKNLTTEKNEVQKDYDTCYQDRGELLQRIDGIYSNNFVIPRDLLSKYIKNIVAWLKSRNKKG